MVAAITVSWLHVTMRTVGNAGYLDVGTQVCSENCVGIQVARAGRWVGLYMTVMIVRVKRASRLTTRSRSILPRVGIICMDVSGRLKG